MFRPRDIIYAILIKYLVTCTPASAFEPDSVLNETSTNQAIVFPVSTSEELYQALTNSTPGDSILLADGVYPGQFTLHTDNITIMGNGDRTIIKLDVGLNPISEDSHSVALKILGNNCLIHSLKIHCFTEYRRTTGIRIYSWGNHITNISIDGFTTALLTHGEDNTISNVNVTNCNDAFHISSSRNSLTNLTLHNIFDVGIHLHYNNNSVSSLTCSNCNLAFRILGNYNKVTKVDLKKSDNPKYFIGMSILSGEGNLVGFFRAEGYYLDIWVSTANTQIWNSVFDTIIIKGGRGHKLFQVDSGRLLFVVGGDGGHSIEKSSGQLSFDCARNKSTLVDSYFVDMYDSDSDCKIVTKN